MKIKYLQILLGGVALLLLTVLFACNKDEKKKSEPQGAKIESISFKMESYSVKINETAGLNLKGELKITPVSIVDTCKITWALSDPSIAKITESGVITPVKEGETKVTATVQGKSAQCKYKVISSSDIIHVNSVSITPSKYSEFASIGATMKLTATVSPSNATDKTVTWISLNTAVATVSSDGTVTCKGVGTATINAIAEGEIGSCEVTYKKFDVSRVSISKYTLAFNAIGQTYKLTAEALPSKATYPEITWSSTDPSVATVDNDGLVTCTGFGSITIYAAADGRKEGVAVYSDQSYLVDPCRNRYRYKQVGTQVWMTENMRCEIYDTQSGRGGASIDIYSSENPKGETFAPYCVDASDMDNWSSSTYAGELSGSQRNLLGYIYNWAAAVGLENASAAQGQTSAFGDKHQGICPNGWHVPTSAEWKTLINLVGSSTGGKKLKTTSGWYNGGNGTDQYSFAVLPAGFGVDGWKVSGVGHLSYIWTSSPDGADNAYRLIISDDDLFGLATYGKNAGCSVRCVKN